MSSADVFMKEVCIKNYLSLKDVTLPLRQLTVLVGPNASGKSNSLSSLELLKLMVENESLPPAEVVRDQLWAGGAAHMSFQLKLLIEDYPVSYQLDLTTKQTTQIVSENLTVGSKSIISVHDGQGIVYDEEDDSLETPYRPSQPKLAIKSAGDYGNKPITSKLNEFIRGWQFYDFQPEKMREGTFAFQLLKRSMVASGEIPQFLNSDGASFIALLHDWFEHTPNRFKDVADSLANATKLSINRHGKNGDSEIYLEEDYDNPISLTKASDGTLRLLAYYILLNQTKLPPLIAIEEPERNLHPAALDDIARALEQLSKRTQVIITTHSSQLLDSFNSDELSGDLSVLLLRNEPGNGTTVMSLDKIREERDSLSGWIEDFGIGSAIFDSELLQDVMGQ